MYCPSCDKSFGAVYSRCPECHSWLKVSAPAKSRSKSLGQLTQDGGHGSVSMLEKEQQASAFQTPQEMDNSGDFKASSSFPQSWGESPSPSSTSWGSSSPRTPSSGVSVDASSSAGSWGSSDWGSLPSTSQGGWSGSASNDKPGPSFPTSDSSWGNPPAEPPAKPNGHAGFVSEENSPTFKVYDPESDDGWGSSAPGASATEGGTIGGLAGSPPAAPVAASSGWLGGGEAEAPRAERESGSDNWLGGATAKNEPKPASSSGWLSGEEDFDSSPRAASESAISPRDEAEDFLDDSWVDDEIDLDDFEHSELPEYVPPTPEVGSMFLKMLLFAVLAIVVAGGVMFMNQDTKTPEQIKAEEVAKQLAYAQSSLERGKGALAAGTPELALGPLKEAFNTFKSLGSHEEELWETKLLMARSLMKAKKYEEASTQWAELAKKSEKYRKEASSQLALAKKGLLASAATLIANADKFAANGEIASVLDGGNRALKILETNQGPASQKGKAYGVIGRGYINSGEYGNAKDALKKALALNPAGAAVYRGYLQQIAERLAPVNYYAGGNSSSGTSGSDSAPQAPRVVEASIDSAGGNYEKFSGHISAGGGRRSASAAPAPEPAPQAAPKRGREAPTYVRPQKRSSGGRPGDRDVLKTY